MKNQWLKKITVALMLSVAFGMTACGAGSEGQSEEDVLEANEDNRNENGNGSTEFFDSGSISQKDDFISVSDDNGNSFVCDDGECNLF